MVVTEGMIVDVDGIVVIDTGSNLQMKTVEEVVSWKWVLEVAEGKGGSSEGTLE